MIEKNRRFLHFAIALALIALGALALARLTASRPELEKYRHPAPVPMARTIEIKTGSLTMAIGGEGTVRPVQEITLVPQVGGKVEYISPSLINGGEFKKEEVLLRIEQADYRLAVTLAGAKIKDSKSKLELTREEAFASKEEWRLLHPGGSRADSNPPALVAKEPQLAAAQARVEADRADLKKALLNLERTVLRAPFDGRVSQENVDVGQYVSTGQALASLYSIGAAEIVLPLKDDDLLWFHVPGFTPGEGPGSRVAVSARIAGRETVWQGEVTRAEGKLDERTRMINVVVLVRRPYSRRPPLAAGLFVSVDIKGRTIANAAVIPRSALRQDRVVWVVDKDGLLRFRKVDVARIQGDDVIISAGLSDGELVVISPLNVVTDGMKVRSIPAKEGSGS